VAATPPAGSGNTITPKAKQNKGVPQ